ncbi:MAG: hypothetical protein JWN86_1113 [Planctomycetota bacterium]|nr:hypothetical protein [Planctomycetota bacterium]
MNRIQHIAFSFGILGASPMIAPAQDQKVAVPAAEKVEAKKIDGKPAVRKAVIAVPAAKVMVQPELRGRVLGGVRAIAVPAAKVMVQPANPNVAVAVDGADANLAPMIAQFTQQYRPVLASELQFVRVVCEPTKEQRKEIAREGEAAFTDAMKTLAAAQLRGRVGNRIVFLGAVAPAQAVGAAAANTEPRYLIQSGLAAAMRKHLSAEQLARYQVEIDKRNADRKELTVHNLVSILDQHLVLTAVQRDQLCDAMLQNWSENWLGTMEILSYNQQYFPTIPDKVIAPILNKTQKKIWDGTQKISGGANFNGFQMRQMIQFGDEPALVGDDDKDDAPEVAAPVQEKKAQPKKE